MFSHVICEMFSHVICAKFKLLWGAKPLHDAYE
jgi:hypothetical protein